tara:strand:- start:16 stop:183 length:168 start_codon:yes stop_codon:yes gene_type:complete
MNVCVWDVRFYMNDDDGNELLNDDGSVKLFTASELGDWYNDVFDTVTVNDLEEVT